jgi:hypothetical protein
VKILLIMASKWEQVDGNGSPEEWKRREWPAKAFYERDKPFAELWLKIHMEGFDWTIVHNPRPFYSMCEIELSYV